MTEPLPAVVDANVVISSFLKPGSVLAHALASLALRRSLLGSVATLVELEDVWLRAKFERFTPYAERVRLLTDFESRLRMVPVTEHIQACRDPRDDKFLELAVSGGADLILSGDADLLALHPFRGVAILSPADYLTGVSEPPR